jgi:hypothetical protein
MAWKIIGIIESRSGDIAILPEWAIGTPNEFTQHGDATTVASAMSAVFAKEKTPIRYLVMPTIDDALISQVRGAPSPLPPQPAPNTLSFGGSTLGRPQSA